MQLSVPRVALIAAALSLSPSLSAADQPPAALPFALKAPCVGMTGTHCTTTNYLALSGVTKNLVPIPTGPQDGGDLVLTLSSTSAKRDKTKAGPAGLAIPSFTYSARTTDKKWLQTLWVTVGASSVTANMSTCEMSAYPGAQQCPQ